MNEKKEYAKSKKEIIIYELPYIAEKVNYKPKRYNKRKKL